MGKLILFSFIWFLGFSINRILCLLFFTQYMTIQDNIIQKHLNTKENI